MIEYIYSDTTGRTYDPSKCVRLVNIKQLLYYLKKGVEILDFYPSKDFKTDEEILVFVVDKLKTQNVYKEWQETRNAEK